MKKVLFVLFLMVSLNAHAACNEGTEVEGQNGHVYCMSKITMNWYTAFMWCEAQGRTLVTTEQMCDIDETQKWDGNQGTGKCLNMVDIPSVGTLWTATPYLLDHALAVWTSKGDINQYTRTAYSFPALCW